MIISALLGWALWQGFTRFSNIPSFIFPSPGDVWKKFLVVIQNGSLIYHTSVTLQEVILGLTLGLTAATITGYLLAKSPVVERVLSPYIVASQSIPIVAIAPLLVIWLGPGHILKGFNQCVDSLFPGAGEHYCGIEVRAGRAIRFNEISPGQSPCRGSQNLRSQLRCRFFWAGSGLERPWL